VQCVPAIDTGMTMELHALPLACDLIVLFIYASYRIDLFKELSINKNRMAGGPPRRARRPEAQFAGADYGEAAWAQRRGSRGQPPLRGQITEAG